MANNDSTVKKLRYALVASLVIGMLISLFLVYEHFSADASKYCTFGSNFDCGLVNKSPYANLDGLSYLLTIDLGMPLPIIDVATIHPILDLFTSNAFLGFLTLVFVVVLLYFDSKEKDLYFLKKEKLMDYVLYIMIFGVVYGFYLFLIQHFILNTYCIFCLGLDVTLVSSLLISWRLRKLKSTE